MVVKSFLRNPQFNFVSAKGRCKNDIWRETQKVSHRSWHDAAGIGAQGKHQHKHDYELRERPDLHNENDEFLSDVTAIYGSRGARQAKELVAEVSGLFAGGELAPEDMDEMMKAIQDAYWIAKENNKKFAPRKGRKR